MTLLILIIFSEKLIRWVECLRTPQENVGNSFLDFLRNSITHSESGQKQEIRAVAPRVSVISSAPKQQRSVVRLVRLLFVSVLSILASFVTSFSMAGTVSFFLPLFLPDLSRTTENRLFYRYRYCKSNCCPPSSGIFLPYTVGKTFKVGKVEKLLFFETCVFSRSHKFNGRKNLQTLNIVQVSEIKMK